MLKAIFFDIDDTFYSTSEFALRARRNSINAMLKMGLSLSREVVIKELEEVISEFTSNYEHHYDKLLVRLPHQCYKGINPAILVASAVVAYHETKFQELNPYPDVIKTLKFLSKTNLIRGVITSGLEIKQAEKLIRLNLYSFLTPKAIFISDQIGINKPNVKFYQRACNELGIKPADAMYVGDNPIMDIDPPNRIGMITVLNERSGKYRGVKGETVPKYTVNNFGELLNILKKYYRVRARC